MTAMINTIVYANLLPFVCLVVFLFFILHNPVFDKKQTKLFFLSAMITLFMIIIVSLDYVSFRWEELGEIFPAIYLVRRMTSFLNFALSPIIPMIVYHIYAYRKIRMSFYLPAIFNFIINFISIFFNVVFFISTSNTYDRGPLFFIPFVTSIFYLAAIIFQRNHAYTKSKRTERFFLLIIVPLLAMSMYLEVAQHFLFLSWDFTAICLVLYYLLLNINRTIIDPLTSAFNRLAYNKEIERLSSASSCIIGLVDINDFKIINDEQGHDMGDIYLQEFTILLEHAFNSVGNVYRIGGDEFVLIVKKADQRKFEECLEVAKDLAKSKNIMFACGWKLYNPEMKMEDFLVEVDQLMYANKRGFKKISMIIEKL